MAIRTENLELIKPEQNDFYDIDEFYNPNMDKIDSAMQLLQDALQNLDDATINKQNNGDIILTNSNKTTTIVLDSKGFSYYTGGSVKEENLIFRVDNNKITAKKQLEVNNKNIETELTNRYTKAETKTEIEAAKTALTNAYKAADKIITDKAQMRKVTKDNGTAYLIGPGADYESLTSLIKNAEPGFYSIRVNTACVDSPDRNRYWGGYFSKPTAAGGYIVINEYGYNRRLAVVNFAADTVSETELPKYWNIFSTSKQLDDISAVVQTLSTTLNTEITNIKNKVQSTKVTPDTYTSNTTGVYEINTATLLEWIKSTSNGTKFIRKQATPSDCPTTYWSVGILNKTSNTSAYVMLWDSAGSGNGKLYWQTFNPTTITSIKDSWNIAATTKQVDLKADKSLAQMVKISTDTGNPIHTWSGVDILTSIIAVSDKNKQMQTFYGNSTVTGGPYNNNHYFGYFTKYGQAINVHCTDWTGRVFFNIYNFNNSAWSGWKELVNKQQLDLKADISKAQMYKITADGGGTKRTVTTDFAEYMRTAPLGMESIYYPAGTLNVPNTGSGRILYHKTNAVNADNTHGIGWAMLFAGPVTWCCTWYGTGTNNLLSNSVWQRINRQQIIHGTGSPSTATGDNGDIYIQYI